MSEIDAKELGRQLMRPTGENGLKVGENMNSSNKLIYDLIISQMKIEDRMRILEIGFGNGKFIPRFFELNPSINMAGIDFSDIMCNEAKAANKEWVEAGKLIVKCEDSQAISFPDEYFDIVVSVNTVYFWQPLEMHLNEIKRVLRKGGLLVTGYRPKEVMKNLPFAQEVFRLFDPEELQLEVEKNGFKVIKEERKETHRKSVDGSEVHSMDICLIAEKPLI
ncbi:MAG TPA: class I SAM-dependent methyltransferase [Bacteroidales bacterium]|nr:class I SAM-dependent methyltransferase [Bacteroidales bacterium]